MVQVSPIKESALNKIVDAAIPPDLVAFLNQHLYTSQYLIINYWSFIHLLAGIIFYKYISKDFKLWIKLNIWFEIIEFLLGFGTNHPLFVEEFIDIVWDILLSLIGFKLTKNN